MVLHIKQITVEMVVEELIFQHLHFGRKLCKLYSEYELLPYIIEIIADCNLMKNNNQIAKEKYELAYNCFKIYEDKNKMKDILRKLNFI